MLNLFSIHKFTINFFFILLTFSQTIIYLSKCFSYFIMKYIHLILFKYLLYLLISGKNMQKENNFFIAFVTTEIFKIFFVKRKFIRYYYFINIYIVYGNSTFTLLKFLLLNSSIIKFNKFFLSIFIYGFKFFYTFFLK